MLDFEKQTHFYLFYLHLKPGRPYFPTLCVHSMYWPFFFAMSVLFLPVWCLTPTPTVVMYRMRHCGLTESMGHVTVRIQGNARNFLYCRPAAWNTHKHTHFLSLNFTFVSHVNLENCCVIPHPAPPPSYSWHRCRLCSDTSLLWPRLGTKEELRLQCMYVCVCTRCLAFAPRALDEEADEVE